MQMQKNAIGKWTGELGSDHYDALLSVEEEKQEEKLDVFNEFPPPPPNYFCQKHGF
jgi:hypothetical protein